MADEPAKRAPEERPERRDDGPEQKRPRADSGGAEEGDDAAEDANDADALAPDPIYEQYRLQLNLLIQLDDGDVAMDIGDDGVEDDEGAARDDATDASDDEDEDTPLAALPPQSRTPTSTSPMATTLI